MKSLRDKPILLIASIAFALFALYTLFISSDRYTSHSKFVIKSQELKTADLLGSISGLPSTDTYQEGDILIAYLNSHEALKDINATLDLRKRFGCHIADWLSCLSQNSSKEDQLSYWKKHSNIHLDNSNGIISLNIQAFTPRDALAINQYALTLSELFINRYNQQIMQDALTLSEHELARAEQTLKEKEALLNNYQDQKNTADPLIASQAKLTIIGELEAQLSQANTELSTLRSYMRSNAPAIIAQQQKINAITQQLSKENQKLLANNTGKNSLPKSDYEKLLLDRELAQKAYAAALAALETARFETKKQQRYLIRISNPELPDEASEPKRLLLLLKTLIGLLLFIGIGQLVILTIKDHIGWT